jgi:hypothetical protein
VTRIKAKGVSFRKEITDFGFWKYFMAPPPDDGILELFQIVPEKLTPFGSIESNRIFSLLILPPT